MKDNITGYEILGRIFFFLMILILFPFFSAFVFQYMWNAIIAHIFAIKQLTLIQAYALAIISNYLTDHTPVSKEKTDWKRVFGMAVGKWLIVWFIFWLIHFFI